MEHKLQFIDICCIAKRWMISSSISAFFSELLCGCPQGESLDYTSYSSSFYTEEVNGPFIEALSINTSFPGIRELPDFASFSQMSMTQCLSPELKVHYLDSVLHIEIVILHAFQSTALIFSSIFSQKMPKLQGLATKQKVKVKRRKEILKVIQQGEEILSMTIFFFFFACTETDNSPLRKQSLKW